MVRVVGRVALGVVPEQNLLGRVVPHNRRPRPEPRKRKSRNASVVDNVASDLRSELKT
jgi:hypothetical protein